MKEIAKYNKGITLIVLIVTVIIMLILVSVTTYTGFDTYKTIKVNRFVTQMQLLQSKIDDLVTTMSEEELDNLGLKTVTTQEQKNAINSAKEREGITTNDISAYKVFTKDNILNILDVEDVQNDIMVNFKTREIVSVAGIEYKDEMYYTQYILPDGQKVIN